MICSVIENNVFDVPNYRQSNCDALGFKCVDGISNMIVQDSDFYQVDASANKCYLTYLHALLAIWLIHSIITWLEI